MTMRFFLAMEPPTVTHQTKQVRVVKGKPIFFEPARLKSARMEYRARLSAVAPSEPMHGPLRLVTKWLYHGGTRHQSPEYKTTTPDTDNMIKLLKDELTTAGFWYDDAQVASEITEKFWADQCGIFVEITEIGPIPGKTRQDAPESIFDVQPNQDSIEGEKAPHATRTAAKRGAHGGG